MHSSPAHPSPSAPSFLLIRISIVLGIVLRLLSLRGELWLDEAWSVLLVQQARSPLDLFTAIRHDNNHLLNSLWLWTLGPRTSEWLLRLPAVVFAAVMLVLVKTTAKRVAPGFQGALWCLLVAVSYPFVLLGSEARGYSLMLLCAVAGFSLVLRLREQSASAAAAVLFAAVCVVGFLAHASFLLFLVPALVWLLVERLRSGARVVDAVTAVGVVVPAAACAAAWWCFYRGAEIGGGPIAPYLQVVLSAVSVSLGGAELSAFAPGASAVAAAVAIFAIIAAAVELVAWRREGDRVAGLVMLLVMAPVLAVLLAQPSFVVVRYFAVALIFLLLLVARFLGRLVRQGLVGKVVAASLVALSVYGNLQHARALTEHGRTCFGALSEQAARLGAAVTVGGDMDNRNELRLKYLSLQGAPVQSLVYVRDYATSVVSPQAVLREESERGAGLPQEFALASGARYAKRESCPAALLEGGEVGLYVRVSQ